jgi:hypothetical protein
VRPWIFSWLRVEAAIGPPGQLWSYGADWSPGPAGQPQWPFDLQTGARTPAWARWLDHSPSTLVARASAAALARYRDRIFIAVGERDEFGLLPPARRFADQLRARGLRPTFLVDEGAGHFQRSRERLARALRFALERLMVAAD